MKEEILSASQGAKVNNIPLSEVREAILTACKRLSLPQRKIPAGETLDYITSQVYRRHHYTVAELYLAVDMYNNGLLNYELPEHEPFGLITLNKLISAYKDVKGKYIEQQVEQQADHSEKNTEARKQTCRMIYESYKNGQVPEFNVFYLWRIAYNHLLDQGKVTKETFESYKDKAAESYRKSKIDAGKGSTLKDAVKIFEDIATWQAFYTVDEYMKSIIVDKYMKTVKIN